MDLAIFTFRHLADEYLEASSEDRISSFKDRLYPPETVPWTRVRLPSLRIAIQAEPLFDNCLNESKFCGFENAQPANEFHAGYCDDVLRVERSLLQERCLNHDFESRMVSARCMRNQCR